MKRVGLAGAGVAGSCVVGLLARDRGRDEPVRVEAAARIRDYRQGLDPAKPLLAVGRGEPSAAAKSAVEALGGMQRFVRPGERVVIKPNVAWDRTPIQAANTNPEVVAALVRLCLEAGAAKVVVTDNPCNEAKRCFTRSGIWKAAEGAGAEVVMASHHLFKTLDLGGFLGRVPVLTPVLEADRLINVAIAKHHGLSKFTGAMKNLYGVIGGRRNRHHQKIDSSITELAAAFQSSLTVMDATRVLLRNGPQGGNLGDTKAVGQVVASVDPVAIDTYACALIGLSATELPYLHMAAKRGLGTVDLNAIEKRGVS